MRRSHLAALLLALAGAVGANELPAALQAVIAQLQPAQRAAIEAHARAWDLWSAPQQRDFARRVAAWDALPMRDHQQRRESWAAWRQLPQDERAELQQAATRFAALDPVSQRRLRDEFAALDESTRRGWMLGPHLGADYAQLQPLLAQVPAGEHAAMLSTLRLMTPPARAKLAVLVQRTPPQDRERLRRELISTSDSNRDAWLTLRLER